MSPGVSTAFKEISQVLSKHISVPALLLSLAMSGSIGYTGWKAYKILQAKEQEQSSIVADFTEWKRQYTQLMPLEERWASSLKPVSEVKDLYSLHKVLGNQPQSNPDTLLVERLDELEQNGTKLGAQRVCISSGSSAGMAFVEKDFSTLMEGLRALAMRPDIQMGAVTLSQERGQAKALVSPLCILLRKEETL